MLINKSVLRCWQEYQKATEPYWERYQSQRQRGRTLVYADNELRKAIRPYLKVWMGKVAEMRKVLTAVGIDK